MNTIITITCHTELLGCLQLIKHISDAVSLDLSIKIFYYAELPPLVRVDGPDVK